MVSDTPSVGRRHEQVITSQQSCNYISLFHYSTKEMGMVNNIVLHANKKGRWPECRLGGMPTTSSGRMPTGSNADGLNADCRWSF